MTSFGDIATEGFATTVDERLVFDLPYFRWHFDAKLSCGGVATNDVTIVGVIYPASSSVTS
jgi:hypothetical protein